MTYETVKEALESGWDIPITKSEQAMRRSRWGVSRDSAGQYTLIYKGGGRIVSIRSKLGDFLRKVRRRSPHL